MLVQMFRNIAYLTDPGEPGSMISTCIRLHTKISLLRLPRANTLGLMYISMILQPPNRMADVSNCWKGTAVESGELGHTQALLFKNHDVAIVVSLDEADFIVGKKT
jgi:hypothetical protein